MLSVQIFLSFSFFFISSAFALKCYSCTYTEEDCKKSKMDENEATFLYTCVDGDRCYRSWSKRKHYDAMLDIGCADQSSCNTQKSICDQQSKDIPDYQCEVSCCSEDGCNTSSYVTVNIILLATSSVLGLALLK